MNVSPFSCVSIKKLLFRLLFSRRQIGEKERRETSLCLFFCVCVSYLGFQILEEREREKEDLCVSLSLSPLRLFLLRSKKTKKKEQQNFSQKKTQKRGPV